MINLKKRTRPRKIDGAVVKIAVQSANNFDTAREVLNYPPRVPGSIELYAAINPRPRDALNKRRNFLPRRRDPLAGES